MNSGAEIFAALYIGFLVGLAAAKYVKEQTPKKDKK